MNRFPFLAVILILIPAIEIFTFIQVGQAIGYLLALLLLIVMTIAGSYLLRLEGLATVQRVMSAVSSGKTATLEVLEGLMVGIAALLLLIPGFVSDVIGLLLLIPVTRRAILKVLVSQKMKSTAHTATYHTEARVIPPEQITIKPHGQTHYDYEGEYVRKD
ncbi:MAG: FxsA family protein [Thiofilum sp.]|uniref:FxsA family protein n=1 Tax=Thiofilum sp. TaxID=2212733 RepID=UPI0025D35958|nr:FxsA family protein [Thiofilum sp.]MBK8451961.1 FxsA family protein [Thiofilum sp.]